MVPDKDASSIQSAVEADPSMELTVDVDDCTVRTEKREWPFIIPEAVREGFITGKWDAIAELVGNAAEVRSIHDSLPYIRGFGGD